MDRLQSMRVFQAVADEGSFAAAARVLDVSAAGVTRLVADLESHVGARLLQRTTRRVSLTDAGTAYLSRIRHILVDIDEALLAAQAHTEEMSGVLRLNAPPVIATHILVPLVVEFRRRHPQIVVDINVDAAAESAISDYDLTLLGMEVGYNANVIARPLVSTDAVLCASPDYIERRGAPAEPQALAQHDCLFWRRPGVRPGVWRLVHPSEAQSAVDVAMEPVCSANHTDTLMRATLEGVGISSQPLSLVAPYLCSGQLVRVLAPWITDRFTLYAALPSRKFVPARTRAFLEFMTERTRYQIREALQADASGGFGHAVRAH